jgi:hypothetical protein
LVETFSAGNAAGARIRLANDPLRAPTSPGWRTADIGNGRSASPIPMPCRCPPGFTGFAGPRGCELARAGPGDVISPAYVENQARRRMGRDCLYGCPIP